MCRLNAACIMHSTSVKNRPVRQLGTFQGAAGPSQLIYHPLLLQTVALSQLDSLRRELISCAKDRLPLVVFAKVCTAPHRNPHMRHKAASACEAQALCSPLCNTPAHGWPDLLQELVREVVAFADMGASSEAGPSAPGSAEQPRQALSPLQQPADGSIVPNAGWVCCCHPAVMFSISSTHISSTALQNMLPAAHASSLAYADVPWEAGNPTHCQTVCSWPAARQGRPPPLPSPGGMPGCTGATARTLLACHLL